MGPKEHAPREICLFRLGPYWKKSWKVSLLLRAMLAIELEDYKVRILIALSVPNI